MTKALNWWWVDSNFGDMSLKGVVTLTFGGMALLFMAVFYVVGITNEHSCDRTAERLGYQDGDYDKWAGQCFVLNEGRWQYPAVFTNAR